MRNAEQEEKQAGIKNAGRSINNLRYTKLSIHACIHIFIMKTSQHNHII